MRLVLTILAVALVALLTAALIAPLFIDWSTHRADIEARLGAMTGGRVTLGGPITLRLLPVPYLDVGQGSAAGPDPSSPRLSFKSARLELALAKLASGEIRFTEVRLDRPVLTLTRDAGGPLNIPVPPRGEADVIGFDRLVAHDGAVRILERAGGRVRTISGVDLDADAPALSGPYSASGQFDGPGRAPVFFRLATEKSDAEGTPIHVSIDAGPGWPALVFDGAFGPASDHTKGPSISGAATLVGSAIGRDGSFPWRVAGRLSANIDAAKLTNAEFRFGSDERALRAEGDATLSYDSSARLTIKAKAKQANIDALLRRKGEDAVAPTRAVSLLVPALVPALAGTGMRIDAEVAAGDVILGSETMLDLSAKISAAPGTAVRTRFDVGLPGRSRLKADGEIETGSAPKFSGAIDFSAGDLPLLLGWASLGAPGLAARTAVGEAFAIRSASLSGDVQASAVGFYGQDLRLTLERSTLTGSLALTGPVGSEPGRLYMDLSSNSLDVGALPTIGASESLLNDLDLSVSLRAKSLHLAHLGEGEIDSGSVVLKVEKSGPKTTLERLNVDDLGGASIDAEGSFGPEGATAMGHLSANKLRDFALLVSRIAPGAWSKAVAERAPLLSPTFLAFTAKGGRGAGGELSLESLRANGTIGQTHLSLAVDPASKGGQVIAADVDAPESGALLRQLRLAGLTVSGGKAHIKLQAAGAWTAGYDVDAAGALAGADISASGHFVPTAEGDEARLFGLAKFKCANVVPLAVSLGLAPPGGTIGPVEVGADVTLRGDRWTFSRLSASVAGLNASGELTYEPPVKTAAARLAIPDLALAEQAVNASDEGANETRPPAITGELTFDRLPLAGLVALALGPPQPAKAGSLWTEAKFNSAPINPPPVAVHVKAGTLDADDGLTARGFSSTLRLDNGRLDLDDMAMEAAGGGVSGRLTLRRDRDSATLNGAVIAKGIAISRPGFSGRIDGTLEFASTGKSPAALIAGLSGNGTVQFAGMELARSDPASLDRVLARSQAPDARLDETNIAYEFGRELDKASLKLPDSAAPLSLSAGAIKLGPLPISRLQADAALNASFDLTRLSLETRLTLISAPADLIFWSGPPPSATVTVQDAFSAPKRKLDVAVLTAGLATQAIARETDRIANLEADIRERAFFNRRLKGERFMERREEQIEDWRAEQARLKGLAEHLESERVERAAAEAAAAQKAVIDRTKADQAAAERREAKTMPQPELPPDISGELPLSVPRAAELGANSGATHAAVPLSRPRPKPRTAPAPDRAPIADPTPGELY